MPHRPHPPLLSARRGVPLLAAALALFALLAADLAHQGPITEADAAVSSWVRARSQAGFTQLMIAVTHLHSNPGIGLMAVTAGVVLLWRGQSTWIPVLAASVGGGLLLNALVKLVFQRARPAFDDALMTLPTFSFPSGHTAGATVLWGFFTVLVLAHRPAWPWKAAMVFVAAGMVSLTALSRVYLGVHHPSDVLAAAAEGCAWLSVCFMVKTWGPRPHASRAAREP